MSRHRGGIALGAAAFAVGLSLAAPLGVASAETDDAGAAPVSENVSRGSAKGAGGQRTGDARRSASPRQTASAPGKVALRTTAPAAAAVPNPGARPVRVRPNPPRLAQAVAEASPAADVTPAVAAGGQKLAARVVAAAAATPTTQVAAIPTASATAAAPGDPLSGLGPIGEFIGGVVQLIRRTFFNQIPTATAVTDLVRPSGKTWGLVDAVDPEGDDITYQVVTAPQFGTVVIDGTGAYVYTPGAGFTGSDTFTVAVDNPDFHINLLDLFGPRRTELTVTVRANTTAPTVVDNFDGAAGSAANPALWSYMTGAQLDDGLQVYTDSPDNVRLDGQGHLVIEAQNTVDGITSARVITQGKLDMTYGTMSARIKFPAGQGIWPSFWMLGSTYSQDTWDALGPTGWPGCGEIDVIEVVNAPNTYHVTLHGPQGTTDYYGGSDFHVVGTSGYTPGLADLSRDYHDFWVVRRPDRIIVGIDDTIVGDFNPDSLPPGGEWVFNKPMFAILQVAVGGPWPGPPDATTPWPATMMVDSFSFTAG